MPAASPPMVSINNLRPGCRLGNLSHDAEISRDFCIK
jgi:hypothetical protein